MGLTAKQFAERCKRKDTKIIKKWYDAGYLGNATKDEKTGVYDIPENTHIPYAANPRIKCNSALRNELLDAADNNQVVAASMYPHISEDDFEAQLKEMVDNNLIEIVNTASGQTYLRTKFAGQALIEQTTSKQERRQIFDRVEHFISTSAEVTTILQALVSLGMIAASILT